MLNNDRHQQTDKFLRGLLENHPTTPPSGIWERVYSIVHGKPFPCINWTRVSFYLSAITAVAVLSYYFVSKSSPKIKNEKQQAVSVAKNPATEQLALNSINKTVTENKDFSKPTVNKNFEENKSVSKKEAKTPNNKVKSIVPDKKKEKVFSKENVFPKKNIVSPNEKMPADKNSVSKSDENNTASIQNSTDNHSTPITSNNLNKKHENSFYEKNPTTEFFTASLGKIPLMNAFPLRNNFILLDIDSETMKSNLAVHLTKQAEDDKYIPNHKMGNYSGFNLGIAFIVNTTSIANQNTYHEFGGSELNYQSTFGCTYGISFGYDFDKPIGIQAEFLINSHEGQHYKDKIGGVNIERKMDLIYAHLPLMFKFKRILRSSLLKTLVTRNIIVGIQGSQLQKATLTLNGTETAVEERFKKYDASILLGWEYAVSLKRQLHFSLGLRGSLSMLDINERSWRNDDKYNYSHNMILGLQTKIYYVFKPYEKPRYPQLLY